MQATVRIYSEKKTKAIEKIRQYSKQYDVLAISKLHKVRAAQIMALRKSFRGRMELMAVKNRLAAKALRDAGTPQTDGLIPNLKGQNLFIFTDISPFKLFLILDKNKVTLPAKAGDIATDTIVVPAGNTGLPPGPVLSEFKGAGVATKIDSGSIWVAKDSQVAKPGDVISIKLAGLLSRLGLKPIKAAVSIYMARMGSLLLKEADVRINLDQYLIEIKQACAEVLALAVGAAYPSKEALPILLSKAASQVQALSVAAGYITRETLAPTLARGATQGEALYNTLKLKGYGKA